MTAMAFLHGWGQSARIWHGQRHAFADARFINLPGHGGAAQAPAQAWVDRLAEALPDTPAILVGWSLGGLLAIQIALRHPHRVAALVLVSTTPCFAGRPDWPYGCEQTLLDGFRAGVEGASAKTLSRFFALMLHGDGLPRADYNALARASIDKQQQPTPAAMLEGLELLERMDLRQALHTIRQPALVVHGADDAVIPVGAGRFLADALPEARWLQFATCGHAPFLTHRNAFNRQLEAWCQSISIPH